MSIVFQIPLKALRGVTDYIDTVENAWITLEKWEIGTCADVERTFFDLGVSTRTAQHAIECANDELAQKVAQMLYKKGAHAPTGELAPKPGRFVYAFYLPRKDRNHGVHINLQAKRTEGHHLRQVDARGSEDDKPLS